MTLDPSLDSDELLQINVLRDRPFSLSDAIGKAAGDFMKGESPIPRLRRAITLIFQFIDQHLPDSPGALQATLKTWVQNHDTHISRHLESPLNGLHEVVSQILNNREVLYEFVRQVDVAWGQMYDERPYFQQPGQPPHPNDEYTHESVHAELTVFLARFPNDPDCESENESDNQSDGEPGCEPDSV